MTTKLRVVWSLELNIDLSFLEQWDTPEKYYDVVPTSCPVCGLSLGYVEAHMFGCTSMEGCDGYKGGPSKCRVEVYQDIQPGKNNGVVVTADGTPVPFDEYTQLWGNPDRYVVLCASVECYCVLCNRWAHITSLCNICFMDIDQFYIGPVEEHRLKDVLVKYQLEQSEELIREARVLIESKEGKHES